MNDPDPAYGPITACQGCGDRGLSLVVSLGYLPPVNRMRPLGARFDQEAWFPADLLRCGRCSLVQLGYAADPRDVFPPDYPYTSGTTRVLRDNFADLAAEANKVLGLQPGDLVADIGSNDGTLLGNFARAGQRVVGIEPTQAGRLAVAAGVPTVEGFFGAEAARRVRAEHGQPRVVTAANVFAHIHRVHEVVGHITSLMGPEGVFISESHYLGDLVATLQYDTVYHEHLRYYSLTSLARLLEPHGLRVFRVKRIPSHGGSIRVYASASTAYRPDDSVAKLLEEEERGVASDGWVEGFRERVVRSKLALNTLLGQLKADGARIVGIGAPSRAATLANYARLDDGVLDAVYEVSTSKKLNKYLPGTRVPVLDEEALYRTQPEVALLLSWHLADELARNLKRRGYRGDFVVPLPTPRVVRNAQVQV